MLNTVNKQHSIKNEIKNNLGLSIPLIASQLIYASSGFIGTALVAKLGESALAASVLVSMIWISLSVLFFGILNAASVLVSHQYGAKNNQAISEIMGQGFLMGIFITIILVLILINMPLFLRWSHQPPEVIKLAIQYMHALLWTIPGLVALVLTEQFLAGIGRTKIVLRISLMIVPIEIPLIYALIFGKFGFPNCGVAGIGYGFAITYSITALGLILYLKYARYYQKFKVFAYFGTVDLRYLKELLRVGMPMGMMHAIEVGAFAVMTFWIAQFGTSLLAAHQIVMQYLSFSITVVFAMSQAVAIRVGHAVGRHDKTEIQYSIYVGMVLNFCCIAVIALLFYSIPQVFLRLDLNTDTPQNLLLAQQASALLSVCAVLLIFDNFRIIGFGALRGLKDTRFPMYASLICFWLIGLVLAYLLGFKTHLDGLGIWWGMTIGIGCGAVILFVRIQSILRGLDENKLKEIGKI